MQRVYVLAAILIALAAPPAGNAATPRTVAVLPLAAADTGLPYAPLPKPDELNIMTSQLRDGLASNGVSLIPENRLTSAVSAAGFNQTTPDRSCSVPECAQKIGAEVHAHVVIVGKVTRLMAVVWGTQFSIVDVKTGKVISELNAGYKGDVQAMERGERIAGACIARVIKGEKPCPNDPGW